MKFLEVVYEVSKQGEGNFSRLCWTDNLPALNIVKGVYGPELYLPDGHIYVEKLDGDDWIPNLHKSEGLYFCSSRCEKDNKATLYFHSFTKVTVRCAVCDAYYVYDVMDVLARETNLNPIVVGVIKAYFTRIELEEEMKKPMMPMASY